MLLTLLHLLLLYEYVESCSKRELCSVSGSAHRYCECDSDCGLYGDCCLDARRRQDRDGKYVCKKVFPSRGVYMVDSCSPRWTGKEEIRTKCQNMTALSKSYFFNVPVTSSQSGTVYANYYCALCNNEADNLNFWKVIMICNDLDKLASNQTELEKTLSRSTRNFVLKRDFEGRLRTCYLIYTPSNEIHIRLCIPRTVQDCPESWENDAVRDLCRNHTALRISSANVPYANKYCALCNNVSEYTCDVDLSDNSSLVLNTYIGPTPSLKEFPCPKGNARNFQIPNHFDVRCMKKYFYVSPDEYSILNYIYNRYFNFYYNYLKWYNVVLTSKASASYLFCTPDSGEDQITFLWRGDKRWEKISCKNISLKAGDHILLADDRIRVVSRDMEFRTSTYILASNGFNEFYMVAVRYQNDKYVVDEFLYVAVLSFVLQHTNTLLFFLYSLAFVSFKGKKVISDYNIFCLVFSFLMISILFTFSDPHILKYRACNIFGIIFYFFTMSYLLWITVIGFDVFMSIRASVKKLQPPQEDMQWFRFFLYSLFAWMVPGLLSATILVFDVALPEDSEYKPNFGVFRCWFGNIKTRLLFFIVPYSLIIVVIIIFFISISTMILSSKLSLPGNSNLKKLLVLFLKLACLLGVSKVFFILSDLFREDEDTMYAKILFKMFDVQMGFYILHLTGKYKFYSYIQHVFLLKFVTWIRAKRSSGIA